MPRVAPVTIALRCSHPDGIPEVYQRPLSVGRAESAADLGLSVACVTRRRADGSVPAMTWRRFAGRTVESNDPGTRGPGTGPGLLGVGRSRWCRRRDDAVRPPGVRDRRARLGHGLRECSDLRPGRVVARAQRPHRGHGRLPHRPRLLAGGRRRRHLHLRRCRLLRLDRLHAPQPAHRGHGRLPDRPRLLAGGRRRRHLHLRRCRLLRLDRLHAPQPAHRGHGRLPDRPGLLAGGRRRRHLHLRRRRPSTARPAACTSTQPDRGHGRLPHRPRLLAGGRRRRHLHLRRRRASTARPAGCNSTPRWWAWPPPRPATATGWWPPTAASSPSATPPSRGRTVEHPTGPRRSGWPGRRPDTGSSTARTPPRP